MKKLKAIITSSFVSSDFCGNEDMTDKQWQEHVARINPGLKKERRLTIRSMDSSARQSALKSELIEAGFKPGDEVVIVLASDFDYVFKTS